MIISKTTTAALAAAALLSLASNAHAYERWTSKNLSGQVIHGIKCDNGDRWLSGDGSIAPTDADAARICRTRGSSMRTGDSAPARAQGLPSTIAR